MPVQKHLSRTHSSSQASVQRKHKTAKVLQDNRDKKALVQAQFKSLSSLSSAPVLSGSYSFEPIQLRGENPHEKGQSHDGWEATAHHVVPHAALKNALVLLGAHDQQHGSQLKDDVLKAAVPDRITGEQLSKMKVSLADFPANETLQTLQQRLKGTRDNGDLDEGQMKKIDNMRDSFYEWQGGNQFVGPNTSIRAEPTKSGDDIDYDGKEFSTLSGDQFDSLTTKGEELKSKVGEFGNTQAIAAVAGADISVPKATAIRNKLLEIIAITRNEIPKDLDMSKWVELTSIRQLQRYHISPKLNRAHLMDYSFFRVGSNTEALNAVGITYSGGDYTYGGKKFKPTVKGTNIFIKVDGAEKIKGTASISLLDNCRNHGVQTSTYLPKTIAAKVQPILDLEDDIASTKRSIETSNTRVAELNRKLSSHKNMKPATINKFTRQKIEHSAKVTSLEKQLKVYQKKLSEY